ncbi:MAG: hypothetical protein U0Z74_04445 [Romboutsia timonensis]
MCKGKNRTESISCQFCNTCNRIRITSDGKIKLCLHSNEETDIRYYLNKPMIFKSVLKEIILKKPDKHNLLERLVIHIDKCMK